MRRVAAALLLSTIAVAGAGADPIRPRALRPGDTIGLITPARGVDAGKVAAVTAGLEKLGYKVKPAPNLTERYGYLAGDDATRAAAIMDLWRDPEVDALFSLAGGFGVTRLLDRLDYQYIREHPKIVTGFSDITALHIAIYQQSGVITFHAPSHTLALTDDRAGRPVQAEWMWRQISRAGWIGADGATATLPLVYPTRDSYGEPTTIVGGRARGRLTGGNLSLIAALCGTPYDMVTDGHIVFLEDVGEEPFRIDRMLSTLRLAGRLDRPAGVVIGRFANCEPENPETSFTVEQVFRQYFEGRPYPVLWGFPTGHVTDNVTLPIGAMAELDADARTLSLLEIPVSLE
jgi:muramoyltetrapeptide carboxypeptidase